MRVLVIPDVHGTHHWEKVKSIPESDYDYAVFLSDFVDAWENQWPDQGENLKAIFDWVRENPVKRKVCLGNHDWSYISGTRYGGQVSGHQPEHASEISAILMSNYDLIALAFETDKWIFAHAGFTHFWVESMKQHLHSVLDKYQDDGTTVFWDESQFSVSFLNDYFHKLEHWPGSPNFDYGFDELLDWYGFHDGSGNEISQGPLWVRPESLLRDAEYKQQLVGHTEYGFLGPLCLKENKHKIVCVDSPTHDNIFIFDTKNPAEKWYSVLSFNKEVAKIRKTILDAKSQHTDPLPILIDKLGFSEEKALKAKEYFS